MELEIEKSEYQGNLELGGYDFNVDEEDLDVLILASRDKIYSSPIKTMVQEYINNAKDACIEAGKLGNEIDIWWPTHLDANFHIRDYGTGISPEDMINVYIMIGKSTKRKNQQAIGKYGLGAKIGFVYADAFMINSYYEGFKYSYWAHKGENQKGRLKPLGEEPTDEPNGIEIVIPINRTQDIEDFRSAIVRAVGLWENLPNIKNVDEDDYFSNILEDRHQPLNDRFLIPNQFFAKPYSTLVLDNGTPYPLDFDTRFHKIAYISRGNEVEIPASREEVLDNHKLEKFLADRKEDEERFYASVVEDIKDHGTFREYLDKIDKWSKIIRLDYQDVTDFESPHPLKYYGNSSTYGGGDYEDNSACSYVLWKPPRGRVLPVENYRASFKKDEYYYCSNGEFPYSGRKLRDIFRYHSISELPLLVTSDPTIINYFEAKPVGSLEIPKSEKPKVRAMAGTSSPSDPNSVCVRGISESYTTLYKHEGAPKGEVYYYNCRGLSIIDQSYCRSLASYIRENGKTVYGLPKRAKELLPKWGYKLRHISEYVGNGFRPEWKWAILKEEMDEKFPMSFSMFRRMLNKENIKIKDPFLRKAVEHPAEGVTESVEEYHKKEVDFLKSLYSKKSEKIIRENYKLIGFACLRDKTRDRELIEQYKNNILNT